jgi:inhibitor of KinA sporulation pathway (predicted exonuclease)
VVRRLDQIVVVDIEATCWEGEPPAGQAGEIIEIGVCLVDVASCERAGRWGAFVRPERSEVSAFCTQLTTITAEQAAGGLAFAEACKVLRRDFQTKDRLWASFGDYDRAQFERQCRATEVPYPFGPGHLNVKTLLAIAHGWTREVGMDGALARLNLPLEGTHHRAADDAWNIGAILAAVLRRARG